jgi:hypothetical protein
MNSFVEQIMYIKILTINPKVKQLIKQYQNYLHLNPLQ